MKKLHLLIFLLIFLLLPSISSYSQEQKMFQIKHGMHYKIVEDTFGAPLLIKEVPSGFLPIPKKKALYRIDDSDYMILLFFSGRVNKITILSDMEYEQALTVYNK